MADDVVFYLVIATALAFDFTNGFHDTANVVATSISTRALPPRVAVGLASILNFVGAFISLEVAATVAKDVVHQDQVTPLIVFGGLIGAIFAANGADAIIGDGVLGKVMIPAGVAPVLAFICAGLAILIVYR